MVRFDSQIAAGGDTAFYLRNGGFLHHWMVYATVEILIFGALLEFRSHYPEERRWISALALALHCLAILFSLTRILWLASFYSSASLTLASFEVDLRGPGHPFWRFSWPQIQCGLVIESSRLDYYSNEERVQMWRVGWKMIREHPVFGVGPGRVEELYTSYLPKGEAVPAYHGHLHNNGLQLAAQFGIPVLAAAALWLLFLFLIFASRTSWREVAKTASCASSLLGTTGFMTLGMADYTYGHALGLILFSLPYLLYSKLLLAMSVRPNPYQ